MEILTSVTGYLQDVALSVGSQVITVAQAVGTGVVDIVKTLVVLG